MNIQLNSPLLDGCVLAVVARGDTYGYSLTQEMRTVVELSESTLYPVLRRLCRDGCLQFYDRPVEGRNRRYYAVTETGHRQLLDYRAAWRRHRDKVDRLLECEMEGLEI